jgi:hypothetical protein
VPFTAANRAAHLPPVSTLFAAFLGYNPIQHLIGPTALAHLTSQQRAIVSGHSFFPRIITAPFRSGLHATFDFAILASLLAAAASWTRGGRYVHSDSSAPDLKEPEITGNHPESDEVPLALHDPV